MTPEKHGFDTNNFTGSRILVVEDDIMQRLLLCNILKTQGYNVFEAEDGQHALDQINEITPDLIISDILMPRMDGFELCRTIHANPETHTLPIILVTALDTREDILKGIDAGANEFLTKPIEPRELSLRVRNAIRSRKLYLELEQKFRELQNLEAMRDNLVHMVVHDMRSVLTGIITTADFLQSRIELRLNDVENGLFNNIVNNSTVLMEMVSTVLDVNRMEDGKMPIEKKVSDMREILQNALNLLGITRDDNRITYELPDEPVWVECDPGIISRVITNLLSNAIKYTRNKEDGKVNVALSTSSNRAIVRVTDNGQGIPESDRELIFEKYAQSSLRQQKKRYSSGLGLYFCKIAVESHGGTIGVDSGSEKGASFFFELETCKER